MRRIPVLFPLSFVALLLASPFRAGPAARSQETTPAALPPLLRQLVDAVNAGDAAAIAALYAEDGAHEDVPAGAMARGREEIAAYVAGVLGQFRDVRFEPVFGRQADDLAVLEYAFSVTDLASGRPLAYRGVLVFDLDETLIRRSADYYDLASILGQLSPGEATAEATPFR